MADISNIGRLVNGILRNIDSTTNTLVVSAVTYGGAGGTNLTKALLDKLVLMEALTDVNGKHNAGNVTVAASPANYTAGTADVEAHLVGIDSALLSAGSDEFSDSLFRIQDNGDATKEIAFEASAITTGTTRTITMPDADVDLGALANVTLSNLGTTAINASLLADTPATYDIGASASEFNNIFGVNTSSDQFFVRSGTTNVGQITTASGFQLKNILAGSNSEMRTSNAAGVTGNVSIFSGIVSGAVTDNSGNVSLASGNTISSDAASDTGTVSLTSGNSTNGDSGAINLTAGTGVVRGAITIDTDADSALLAAQPTGGTALAIATTDYVDTEVATAITSEMSFKGDYDAATNSPDLDSTPIATAIGDTYVVTVAGTFFATDVEIGDMLMAKQATATAEAHWSIVQANLTPATIKTQYESNSDTNAFTDAEQTIVGNTSGTNTGDEVAASDTVAGIVELATENETNMHVSTTLAVTPAGLATMRSDIDDNLALSTTNETDIQNLVNDSITDANTTTAPSENAVFDALALKSDTTHTHNRIVKTFVAGEAFAANTTFLVRMAITGETAGRVYKADKDASAANEFYVMGIVEGNGAAAISAAANIDVILLGEITLGSSDTNFAAAEVGEPVHLLATGAFDAVSQITYAADEASYRSGVAIDVDKILVGNMQLLGIN